jgi:hypothetical protein
MQLKINRHGWVGEVIGPQNFLRIIHVNVVKYWKAQKTHGFLAMHRENDPGVMPGLDPGDELLPRGLKKPLFENWLKCRKPKEQRHDTARSHPHFLHEKLDVRFRIDAKPARPSRSCACSIPFSVFPASAAAAVAPASCEGRAPHAAETPGPASSRPLFLLADSQAAAVRVVALDVRSSTAAAARKALAVVAVCSW